MTRKSLFGRKNSSMPSWHHWGSIMEYRTLYKGTSHHCGKIPKPEGIQLGSQALNEIRVRVLSAIYGKNQLSTKSQVLYTVEYFVKL